VKILGDAFKTELPGGVYEKDFQQMETLGRPDPKSPLREGFPVC